jgi:inosine-uridine nucleoside N-ribohydrolase
MLISRRSLLQATPALMAAQPSRLEELLSPPKGPVAAVLDTDTYNEIDDQYAVAYSLLSPKSMAVEAIYAAPYLNDRSTSPANGMEKSYEEILRLLKFLRRDSKDFVYRGSDRFFARPGDAIDSPAARDLIAKALKPRSSPLYVLTIGCPANVSSAILMEPKIKDKIVVVWLGGTTHVWPSAREFNLQQDVFSSQVLFDSGVPLVQIPTKNVSEHLRTTLPELERFMKGRSRLGDYLYDQFVDYYKVHTKGKPQPFTWSKVIWDISAVAWIINPAWVPSAVVASPVLTNDLKWNAASNRHPIRVATDIHRDEVFHDLFEKIAATGS